MLPEPFGLFKCCDPASLLLTLFTLLLLLLMLFAFAAFPQLLLLLLLPLLPAPFPPPPQLKLLPLREEHALPAAGTDPAAAVYDLLPLPAGVRGFDPGVPGIGLREETSFVDG